MNAGAPGRDALRVLVVTSDLGGGTGNHLLSIANRWAREGVDVRIATENAPLARIQASVPIVRLRGEGRRLRFPLAQLSSLRRVGRLIREFRPHVVHTYFYWPILYGRVLKKVGRIGALVENREDQGFNWNNVEYAALRISKGLPDRVLCVSSAVRDTVGRREGVDAGRIEVVRNGIALPGESPTQHRQLRAELGFADDAPIVGMVANYGRAVKGVSYFVQAIPRIVDRVPEARFVLLGRGRNENEVRAEAERVGAAPYLVFAGFREDIAPYYELMVVSVLTSLSEGLSITLLESMSYGVPVVATRVGGNPELVVDGETGFLVPPTDVQAFARRVIELLKSPELRRALGTSARARIREHFLLDDVADRYLDVYQRLLP